MSSDRELLELAAKAAGIEHSGWDDCLAYCGNVGLYTGLGHRWNPLTDDGDALRLAVKLHMDVDVEGKRTSVIWNDANGHPYELVEDHFRHADAFAATRRAIVRAAAEIGRSMP